MKSKEAEPGPLADAHLPGTVAFSCCEVFKHLHWEGSPQLSSEGRMAKKEGLKPGGLGRAIRQKKSRCMEMA